MGDRGVSPDEHDSEPAAEDQTSDTGESEAERVIRHRITGHKAALEEITPDEE